MTAADYPTVRCYTCGESHPAEPSHVGRFGEGQIYAVVCTADYLTDYYTTEALEVAPADRPTEGEALARIMARATGSTGATVRVEHRDPATGELVTDSVATWTRPAGDEDASAHYTGPTFREDDDA